MTVSETFQTPNAMVVREALGVKSIAREVVNNGCGGHHQEPAAKEDTGYAFRGSMVDW